MPCITSVCDSYDYLYPMGTATMNTHKKERKDELILLETVLQSRSLSQLSKGGRTSDHNIVIEGCGQINRLISQIQCMDYHYDS